MSNKYEGLAIHLVKGAVGALNCSVRSAVSTSGFPASPITQTVLVETFDFSVTTTCTAAENCASICNGRAPSTRVGQSILVLRRKT